MNGPSMGWRGHLRDWARRLKRDLGALALAARDPRVPLIAKAVAAAAVAYALSPIDLIPDFVPVLGLLDDLIILPLALALAMRLVGPELMAEFRARAQARLDLQRHRGGALVVVAIWLAVAGALALLVWP